jgi:hypothetical protein
VSFEVSTALFMKNAVFWNIMPRWLGIFTDVSEELPNSIFREVPEE